MNAALLRLILAQISIHACMTGMRMATPLLALREGFSAASVGFLLALFALTQVFLSLPAGRYADRHGLRVRAERRVVDEHAVHRRVDLLEHPVLRHRRADRDVAHERAQHVEAPGQASDFLVAVGVL